MSLSASGALLVPGVVPGAEFVNAALGGALKIDCCKAVAVTSPTAAAGL